MSYLALKECNSALFISDYLYRYLRTPSSLTSNKNPNLFYECFKIYDYIYTDILKTHPSVFDTNNLWSRHYLNASFAFLEINCTSLKYKEAKKNINVVRRNALFVRALSIYQKKDKQRFLLSLVNSNHFLLFYLLVNLAKTIKKRGK